MLYDQFKDALGSHKENLAYMEVLDIEKQLNFDEGLSDDSDYVQLSSNSKFLSILSSDDSQYYYYNLPLPWYFSSVLSLSGNCHVFFDGSRISPIDEANLVLDRPLEGAYRGISKKEVAFWLHTALRSEVKNSSAACSESDDSSYDRSLCDDSSSFESLSTSLSTQEETPLFVPNFDSTGIWVPSLDLDVEDSELVCDEERLFDVFDCDFPSPSVIERQKHQPALSITRPVISFGQLEEFKSSSEVCDSDEPLFWPFDRKSYWLMEFEKNFLCMSPRKDGISFGVQTHNILKADGSRLQNCSSSGRRSRRKECYRRRILFNPSPNLSSMKHNTEFSNKKNIQNIGMSPLKLSRSSRASSKGKPLNISIPERGPLLDLKCKKRICDEQLLDMTLNAKDASKFQDKEEVSIEKMVGLNEFDGHEGLDMESGEDACTLIGSPFKMSVSSKDMEHIRADSPHNFVSRLSAHTMDNCCRQHSSRHEVYIDVHLSDPCVQSFKIQ